MSAELAGLTAVSLFAGIEGFGLALQRAGVAVKAAVEIDPACRGVIRRHFPQTALFNDVTKVTAREILAAGFVPRRGILAGGWPCQDVSIAGRRAGLGGARSGLFWHFMRLADELRPQWILAENVPGLLSAVCPCPGSGACVANRRAVRCGEWRAERVPGGPDLGPVCPGCEHDWDVHDAGGFCARCQDTCEGLPEVKVRKVWYPDVPHAVKGGACPGGCMPAHGGAMGTVLGALGHRGYGFAYRVLDAQFFGVPQRRERVFIAGCLGDRAAPVEVLLEPEGGQGHPAARRQAWSAAAAGAGRDAGVPRVTGALTAGSLTEYDDNTAAAGQLISHAITARERKGADSDVTSGLILAATIQGGGRRGHRVDAEGAAGGHLVPVVADTLRSHPRPTSNGPGGAVPVAMRGRDAHALTSEGVDASSDASEDGTGCGTPLVTVPVAATLTAGTSAGEGVRPPGRRQEDDVNLVAGAMAFNPQTGGSKARLGYGEKPTALQANQVTAVQVAVGVAENQRGEVLETPVSRQLTTGGGKPGQGYGAVRQDTAVRRLTPRECERLQGFPDDWTRWLDDGTEQSDSARYRQCGNAVAVPVVEWIARRVAAVDAAAGSSTEGAA